ncbi:MAG TPA: polysaccharide biosynthesis tyrosine autokinase [Steroidobacteraceae bacterium]|jgi:chain length determinant protein tyrosine kinase EpsG
MSVEVQELLEPLPLQHRPRTQPVLDLHIGQVLLRAGKLNENDIQQIVAIQGSEQIRFGDAAVKLGMLDRHDVQQALALQFAYPCLHGDTSLLSRQLVAAFEPFGPQAEALRRLRTQLSMRWFSRRKLLAVTSARANEGASLVAANLAIGFAQVGVRTLLIDANFRTPTQHRLFGRTLETGLSTLLADRAVLDEVVTPIEGFAHLALLCAGPIPPNPQELLERTSFVRALNRLGDSHDVVLIDGPPLLECADTQTLASRTSGCLLSMRRHATRVSDVEQVKALLRPASAVLVGSVLCD